LFHLSFRYVPGFDHKHSQVPGFGGLTYRLNGATIKRSAPTICTSPFRSSCPARASYNLWYCIRRRQYTMLRDICLTRPKAFDFSQRMHFHVSSYTRVLQFALFFAHPWRFQPSNIHLARGVAEVGHEKLPQYVWSPSHHSRFPSTPVLLWEGRSAWSRSHTGTPASKPSARARPLLTRSCRPGQ
jgi:hypothetical protein